MSFFVNVRFSNTYDYHSRTYLYRLPDSIKISKLKEGDPIVVPVGNQMDLKVAYISAAFEDVTNPNVGFEIKEAYGLVRKL